MPSNLARHAPATSVGDLPADSGLGDVAASSITPSMQDYLRAIYDIEPSGEPVTTQRLAERLSVSGPSVTCMAKRLDALGLVRHTRYHGVTLTPAGERVALGVLRRYRLIEQYLVETLGYAWDEVHAEAERLEHHVSAVLEARMDAVLGHPIPVTHTDRFVRADQPGASPPDPRIL